MTSCNSNNKFFGNRVQASRGLFTNRIDSINKNNNITIGGCADEVVVQGDLIVTGDNCATCLKTNDPDVDVNVSGSNPPTAGQVLVALDSENAEWQAMSGSGMGDVSGPASSTNNEIVRFDGTTGKLIKSDSSAPTTIDNDGRFSGPVIETSGNLVALGQNISKNGGITSTVIGNNAGTNLDSSSFANTFIGTASGNSTTTGNNNTFVGDDTGALTTTANNNTFVGSKSGSNNTIGTLNTFVGEGAGENNTTANDNTFIGSKSGSNNTIGTSNTFVGVNSGSNNVDGIQNVYLGSSSSASNNGSANVVLGHNAGQNMNAQNGCVLLGYNAGQNNTQNDRLMIDNTNTNSPLIDGDFSVDTLQINGETTLGETGNTTNVHAINGSVDPSAGTVNQYLIVSVNGTQFKIPLHNLV